MTKLTIADIAKQAGVGKSTVSRYLNNGYVKEETAKKIKQVIDSTGYEPSAAAQNLKLHKTRTIGIVVPTVNSISAARQIKAIDATLRKEGYTSLMITTDHDPDREIEAIEYFRSLRVDGIILSATNISKEHQRLQSSSSIPFLVIGQKFDDGHSIIYDDYAAGKAIGSYCYDKGHRDVLYLGVDEQDEAVGIRRKQGVLDGLKDAEVKTAVSTFNYEETRKVIRSLLDEHVPSLLICASDKMALACWKEIIDRGLCIPEDISIAAFGGYESSALLTPPLTTIRFKNEEAGTIAAKTLISLSLQQPVPIMQMVGFDFVEGESVVSPEAGKHHKRTEPLEPH